MPFFDQAIELARLAGDDHQLAINRLSSALCPSYGGRVEEAIAMCNFGLAGVSAISCEARAGDPEKALGQYADLIDHWHRAGAWNMQWITLRTLIELLARLGRDVEAARLYGAMTASATAPPVAGSDATRIAEAVATMRSRLGDEQFEVVRAEGSALSDGEAVRYALGCVGRGRAG